MKEEGVIGVIKSYKFNHYYHYDNKLYKLKELSCHLIFYFY